MMHGHTYIKFLISSFQAWVTVLEQIKKRPHTLTYVSKIHFSVILPSALGPHSDFFPSLSPNVMPVLLEQCVLHTYDV